MTETAFRITKSQLLRVERLLETCEPGMIVPVVCGHGKATLSAHCTREVWCANKILHCCRPDEIKNPSEGMCIFVTKQAEVDTFPLVDELLLLAYIDETGVRVVRSSSMQQIEISCVVDHDLSFFTKEHDNEVNEFAERTKQAFGTGTVSLLSQLTVAVAGVSGTGSIVAEQLVRLGVKRLILIDDDIVETRNLNRILNAKCSDAEQAIHKTTMLAKAYADIGLPTEIVDMPIVVDDPKAIHAISVSDIIFGCLDSADGRNTLNRIATFYSIPYLDIGVKLVSDSGKIREVNGAVRFLLPGESSLLSRNVFTRDRILSDALRRRDPDAYQARLAEKYIIGAQEASPAVISVNMQLASLGVLELLARIHCYRDFQSNECETVYVDLSEYRFALTEPTAPDTVLQQCVGKGDGTPLIGMPTIGE